MILLAILFLFLSARAEIIEVFLDESIQDAVNESAAHDTILIHDGNYQETVILSAHPLVICSNFLFDGDTTHIANTILRANSDIVGDTMSCIVIRDLFEDLTQLIGFTLRDGEGTLYHANQNESYYSGGAVFIWKSDIRIRNCVIENSQAMLGGGVFVYGYPDWNPIGSLQINNSVIRDCYSHAWGGGIYANHCSLTVRSCVFQNDTAFTDGGGIIALDSKIVVGNTAIETCYALYGGTGGVTAAGRSSHIFESYFEGNASSPSVYFAAHLGLSQGYHVVEGCYFGYSSSLSKGINFCCDPGDTHIFRGNIIEQNVATAPFGIGNVFLGGSAGEFAYNIIRDNESREAQLYAFQGTTMLVHHNVFTNNVNSYEGRPSVLRTGPNPHQQFFENIINGNSANTIDYAPGNPSLIDARNNWWGHESGPYHPTQNPGGQGDTIFSDSVLFIPWLTAPPDTTMPSSVHERPTIPSTWELLSLFPNPFNSSFTLVLTGFTGTDFTISIYDILGKEVAVLGRGAHIGGQYHYTAPPDMASGVYFVRLHDAKKMDTRKIIFMK